MRGKHCRLSIGHLSTGHLAFGLLLSAGACALVLRDGAPGPQALAGEAPAFEKQVNLVYTVSNFGYIDTCG